MSFQYSCFISYRREKQSNKFIEEFTSRFNQHAFYVTNKDKQFLDRKEINGSPKFGNEIYDAIRSSYFFNIFYFPNYLHTDDIWCAKELRYAMAVEEERKKLLSDSEKDKFCILNIFILSGSADKLPKAIKDRNAEKIASFQYSNYKTTAWRDFVQSMSDFMYEMYAIYQSKNMQDFIACCDNIVMPTDDEIRIWINEQVGNALTAESAHLPVFKKENG